jgi:hypothetical protein
MTAFLSIASRQPCHSPFPLKEGGLNTNSGRDGALRRPQGQPKIVRHFSAGTSSPLSQVPKGRLNLYSNHRSIKPYQAVSSHFQKKKIVYFFADGTRTLLCALETWWFKSRSGPFPANLC